MAHVDSGAVSSLLLCVFTALEKCGILEIVFAVTHNLHIDVCFNKY